MSEYDSGGHGAEMKNGESIEQLQAKLEEMHRRIEALEDIESRCEIAEKKYRELESVHKLSNEASQAAEKSKTAFLSNISGEFRKPLNSMITVANILLENYFGNLNDNQEEYIKDIKGSAEYLINLVDYLLDIARIDSGESPLELGDTDLYTLLENSLVIVRERANKKRITLEYSFGDDVSSITADEKKVKQIVILLLVNAIKNTPENGKAGIATNRIDNGVRICVWDNGKSLPANENTELFGEPELVEYFSEETKTFADPGLSLVKRYVEQHNGRIWVESGADSGNRFCFYLPFRPTEK